MLDALPLQPVVIAPTFNNACTLGGVLDGVARLGLPIIVVNDGSTDATAEILQVWQGLSADRMVLTHVRNQGKAAALLGGFERAAEQGYTHAITIDTDGQLDPAQIPDMLCVARRSSDALVVGSRDEQAPGYPAKSRLGRRVSNLLVRWQSGARLADSQCGFRVYPLQKIRSLPCWAGRYGFETEILTRAAWAGVAIEQTSVTCMYDIPGGRVSHFRPWRDSLSAVKMHLRLLARSSWPWPVSCVDGAGDAVETGTIWRRFLRWISPARAWRAVRDDPAERPRFAAGLAAGVFIANLPLYGVQTLLSLYAARRLRLNPLTVVVGSHFSTPPIGPLLITAAIVLGHWVTRGTLPALKNFNPSLVGYRALIESVLLEWTIGALLIGTLLAAITFVLARLLLRRLPVRLPVHTPQVPERYPAEQAPTPDPAAAESAA